MWVRGSRYQVQPHPTQHHGERLTLKPPPTAPQGGVVHPCASPTPPWGAWGEFKRAHPRPTLGWVGRKKIVCYLANNFKFQTVQISKFLFYNSASRLPTSKCGEVWLWSGFCVGLPPPHTKTTPKHNLAKLGNWKLKNSEFPISQFGKWAWGGPPHPTPT